MKSQQALHHAADLCDVFNRSMGTGWASSHLLLVNGCNHALRRANHMVWLNGWRCLIFRNGYTSHGGPIHEVLIPANVCY